MVAEMSGIRIVNSLPDRGWRAFIAANPNSNIFHTPEMFEVFARAERHHPTLWAAVDAEGCPLALLLPVQVTLFDSLPRRLTTRAIVYGSLLWQAGEAGMQALNELLNAYIREMGGKALFTELRNTSDLSAVRSVLQEHRFVHQDYLNYLIDLDMSPEALLQSIGPRTRKNIRRALNRGVVEVEEVRDERGLRAWYEVLQKTYRNARVPLANLSLFQAALEVLLPKGMVRFSQARVGADIVATSVELLYERSIYGWYGGIDRDSAYPGATVLKAA